MALRNISKFFDQNCSSNPPTDVSFLFKEEGSDATKEVKAHKAILAFASDVFNREFYGSLKSEEMIDIQDASHDVFQALVWYIYNPEEQIIWENVDLEFLAALYYLAEKYNVESLRDEIIAKIPEHKVTKENVLSIAIIAEENSVHHHLSDALYESAASFIVKENGFKEKFDKFDLFGEENAKHSLVIFKLMERVKKMDYCEKCKQSECLDGKGLTLENFTPGAQVIGVPPKVSAGLRILSHVTGPGHFVGTYSDGVREGGTFRSTLSPEYYLYRCV